MGALESIKIGYVEQCVVTMKDGMTVKHMHLQSSMLGCHGVLRQCDMTCITLIHHKLTCMWSGVRLVLCCVVIVICVCRHRHMCKIRFLVMQANIRVLGKNGSTQMLKVWLPGLMQLVGDHSKVAIADSDITSLLDASSGLRIQSDT